MERVGIVCVLVALLAPQGHAQEVLVNEVLADPASDWNGDATIHSRDDEWVEIVNASATTVDLAGFRLASADTTWRYGFTGLLGPGEVRVVYGSDAYAWEQESGNPAYGLRLTNTGATIGLWQITATDTVLVDEVTYSDEAAEDDRSAGRLDTSLEEWVLYDGLNPYDGAAPPVSTGCPPTPGTTNQCLTPVIESSWGAVKAAYGPDRDVPEGSGDR
jgi:hypothetical protein